MSAPPRLIDSGRSPMVRQLLAAGCAERAPHTTRNRALAQAAVVASSLGVTHAAAGTAAGSATLGAVGFVKAFGSGILAGAVVLGGARLTTLASEDAPAPSSAPAVAARQSESPRPRRSAALAPVHTAREIIALTPSGPARTPPVASYRPRHKTFEPDRATPEARPSTSPPPSPTTTDAPEAAEQQSTVDLVTPGGRVSLAEERRLVDAARQAVAEGRPSAALAALEQYRAIAPHGRFGPECEALQVEARALQGDRAAARAMAVEFLRRHPESPLLDRVRAQLDPPPDASKSP